MLGQKDIDEIVEMFVESSSIGFCLLPEHKTLTKRMLVRIWCAILIARMRVDPVL